MQSVSSGTWLTGIDVSLFQQEIDWDALKADPQNVKFAYVRTYGSNHTTLDTYLTRNVDEAKRVGIPTGGYYYCMPFLDPTKPTASEQAQQFIDALQLAYGAGNYGELLPVMDLEDSSGWGSDVLAMTVDQVLDWGNEFRNYFESNTGRKLAIYTSENFVSNQRDNFNEGITARGNILKDMPLWIAGYERYGYTENMPNCGGWTEWQLWQYNDQAHFQGVTDDIDGVTQLNVDIDRSKNIEWIMPPKDVIGLSATDDGVGLTITWNPNTEEDIEGYDIYVDNSFYTHVAGATTSSFVINGLARDVEYTIDIKATDIFGDDSFSSVSVTHTIKTPAPIPKVTILSVSRTKISDEIGTGADKAEIHFSFDTDTTKFTVNVNGVSYNTGFVADSGGGKTVGDLSTMLVSDVALQTVQQIYIVVAGFEIVAEVDYTELQAGGGEGNQRINIYGKNVDGVWTPYNQQ